MKIRVFFFFLSMMTLTRVNCLMSTIYLMGSVKKFMISQFLISKIIRYKVYM
jgi:hypothetical protein